MQVFNFDRVVPTVRCGWSVAASATSMLQTTNQRSPTAFLTYKPN